MKRNPNKTAFARFQAREEQAIDDKVRELEASGQYDFVLKHVPYASRGYNGELDILAGRGPERYYIERKGSDRRKVVRNAIKQFERCKIALPGYIWHFTLYTPKGEREYSL